MCVYIYIYIYIYIGAQPEASEADAQRALVRERGVDRAILVGNGLVGHGPDAEPRNELAGPDARPRLRRPLLAKPLSREYRRTYLGTDFPLGPGARVIRTSQFQEKTNIGNIFADVRAT